MLCRELHGVCREYCECGLAVGHSGPHGCEQGCIWDPDAHPLARMDEVLESLGIAPDDGR